MSDEQIRDVFQSAEQWTPDNDSEGDGDGNVNGNGASPGPNSALPPLQLGSDVEIAGCVAQLLRTERGEVVFCEGALWYYAGSHWRKIDDHELRLAVHRYDGSTIPGSSTRVKLGKTRVDSVLSEMRATSRARVFSTERQWESIALRASSVLRQMELRTCGRMIRETAVDTS